MCKYTAKYYNYDKKRSLIYKCPLPSLRERGEGNSDYCAIHDPEYWKKHQDETAQILRSIIRQAKEELKSALLIGVNVPGSKIKEILGREVKIPIYLNRAKIYGVADLSSIKFTKHAGFARASFGDDADFSGVRFKDYADFFRANFEGYVDFSRASFGGYANFTGASFRGEVSFTGASFGGNANFFRASFRDDVSFTRASFRGEVSFTGASFGGNANFTGASFKRWGDFRYVRFLKPEWVMFDEEPGRRNISRACLLYVEGLDRIVIRDVYWARSPREFLELLENAVGRESETNKSTGGGSNTRFKDEKRYVVFDEALLYCDDNTLKELHLERPSLGKVLEVYRMLRHNLDSRARYYEAGMLFRSEMEVQRLFREEGGRVVRNGWLRRNISLIAWYKHLSMYGESYLRPIAVSALLILLFAFLRCPDAIYRILNGLVRGVPLAELSQHLIPVEGSLADSLSAYLQFPRREGAVDMVERAVSLPILGLLVVALRRRFERRIR